jgi:predicted Na+-dependent transporter
MGSVAAEVLSSLLLFFLVFGMSATVEVQQLRKHLHSGTALLIGITLQFLILPFVGFLTVKLFQLPATVGITLLVITSSPGGSYSNWWCSMFNADLALSVTMTACSTLLSTVMLPTNLVLYTRWTYSPAVVKSLDWRALFVSLAVVIGGISAGLLASHLHKLRGHVATFHRKANTWGNVAGVSLITLSIFVSSSDNKAALWDQDARFYIGCAVPAAVGLCLATYAATRFDLAKPERVAVAVEACYQNTGIATSVALTMFQTEEDLATAVGVPLYYGIVEAVFLATFCLVCWKLGWTKAPPDENLCKVLATSYEVEPDPPEEEEVSIEVVLGSETGGDDGEKPHLVFSQHDNGDYIVDEVTLQQVTEKGQNHAKTIPRQQGLDVVAPSADNNAGDDHTEDMTECSIQEEVTEQHPQQAEDGEQEADGIMVTGVVAGTRPPRRRRRLYTPLEAPISPTASSESTAGSDADIDAKNTGPDGQQRTPTTRRIKKAISNVRARAAGYRKYPTMETDKPDDLPPAPPVHSPPSHEEDDNDVELSSSGHAIPVQRIPELDEDELI